MNYQLWTFNFEFSTFTLFMSPLQGFNYFGYSIFIGRCPMLWYVALSGLLNENGILVYGSFQLQLFFTNNQRSTFNLQPSTTLITHHSTYIIHHSSLIIHHSNFQPRHLRPSTFNLQPSTPLITHNSSLINLQPSYRSSISNFFSLKFQG